MRLRIRVQTLMLGLGLLLVSQKVDAQSSCTTSAGGNCTRSTDVEMTLTDVVELNQSSTTVALGAPTAADYTTGYKPSTGPSLTIRANSGWTLKSRASTSVWSATNTSPGVTARTTKPASDLRWSLASGGTFTGFTTTLTTLTSGSATAGTTQLIYFRTLYSWTLDTPGAYSLDVVFTISTP